MVILVVCHRAEVGRTLHSLLLNWTFRGIQVKFQELVISVVIVLRITNVAE